MTGIIIMLYNPHNLFIPQLSFVHFSTCVIYDFVQIESMLIIIYAQVSCDGV